jgi:UDP-N-acetyl-D-glucosamine dehydrogenase
VNVREIKKVAVVGQGYVGFPLAVAAASAGYEVIGIDSNESLIEGLEESWQQLLKAKGSLNNQLGNYQATTDVATISECEIVILCLPTPLDHKGNPDHSIVINAAYSLKNFLKPKSLLINESTVEPGFNLSKLAPIFSELEVDVAFSPERIDPGNKEWNLTNTPKLVAGMSEKACQRALEFYETFVEVVIRCSSIQVAESAKLLENSFRLVNISFINEFSRFCDAMNLNIHEVIEAASTKPYGFTKFSPSIGIGGHCIPVDPKYLSEKSRQIGVPLAMVEQALLTNNSNPKYYADKISSALGGLKQKRILLVGISYKKGTKDLRESAAVKLVNLLRERSAEVHWHDPVVATWNTEISSPIDGEYDLVLINHKYSDFDIARLNTTIVWDLSPEIKKTN